MCNNCQTNRLHKKQVSEQKLIHNFNSLANITTLNKGNLTVSSEQLYNGSNTLKVTVPAKQNCFRVRVNVDNENWENYNRISFFIYPVKNGFNNSHMCIEYMNDGVKKCPSDFIIRSLHYATLTPNCWNQVTFEIPELPRDKVTAVQLNFLATGVQANMQPENVAYLSNLTVQKVNAEKYNGWKVENGKIAVCHSGYGEQSKKIAVAELTDSTEFLLIDNNTKKTVFVGKPEKAVTEKGDFARLPFTEFTTVGTYTLQYGNAVSYPFQIKQNRWDTVLDKLQNFFFEERCGCYVKDIHLPCHEDSFSVHPNGNKISVSGGWHDAGDLSQGLCNTAESVCAFLQMAEKFKNSDQTRYTKFLNEAKYGLDWVLKTTFHDGYRAQWTTMTEYTKGIVGDDDDIFNNATNFSHENLCAALAEVLGYFSFNQTLPEYAEYCLNIAKEDFSFALQGLNMVNGDIHHVPAPKVQLYGELVYVAALIYKATGENKFLENAVAYSEKVMACQQTTETDWNIKCVGFFYRDESCSEPLTYDHRAHDQAIVMGIAFLLKLLPQHSLAPKWKNCLYLYKKYILFLNSFSLPYGNLPSGIYFENVVPMLSGSGKISVENYNEQLNQGVKLANGVFLRQMPVVEKFRGNFGIMLSKAKAVSAVAKALNSNELLEIAAKQVEFILGNNPFCKSFMYGEGYDYPEMFCDVCHNIVGALPVGLSSLENQDTPYMPIRTCATYLEIWVHPASRMMWTIADLY